MTKRRTAAGCSLEVWRRAVRMVPDGAGEHGSRWAAADSIVAKIGCTAETPRRCVRQANVLPRKAFAYPLGWNSAVDWSRGRVHR